MLFKLCQNLKFVKLLKKRYRPKKGKIFLRRKAFKGHLLEKKIIKTKRNLTNTIIVNKADTKAIRRMLVC
uniref:50S ribosomal protein L35 n=1 Tax=Choristocarpus tenellus TaxID=116065 RepID=UPI002E76664B|nr:50S ribosomal protein L35 [Choristocarpus tenellus]WAM62390.1 50S ribosomal protein L35 [Choristocarpus tenellus]